MSDYPLVPVDFEAGCGFKCRDLWDKFSKNESYVGSLAQLPSTEGAYLDLRLYSDAEAYVRATKQISKGGPSADKKRAERAGYVIDTFAWKNHIPDIYGPDGIHRSKETRNGVAMKPHYLKSVEAAGGAPTQEHGEPELPCYKHWRVNVGIFQPIPGYKQGSIVTDRKLVGYIGLLRMGSLALYSMIIGHGAHLQNGIMGAMHMWIVEGCYEGASLTKGLKGIGYAGMFQGGYYQGHRGLYHWKRKCLFRPVYWLR